ncbi:hypothetical protein [Paenibacillus sp. SN-8-1]|uniref:hypothetical protein n=1 Tax=Paenibacillus sp. SN-8-1 TaxID=3435409 RepID=UPI003D9A680D
MRVSVTEGKLGTVGAKAPAFVSRFHPPCGINQEIWRQQRPKVQAFPVVTTVPTNVNIFSACLEPGMGTYYFEVDPGGTAFRQMVIEEDGSLVVSNRKHEQFHFMLAEHPIDVTDPYYEPIPKSLFEELWTRSLETTMEEWNQVKLALPVGMEVEGAIEAFFPQGTLVNLLQDQAIGLADTTALDHTTPVERMYSGFKLAATVKDYDELNQWVLLDHARVLEAKRR